MSEDAGRVLQRLKDSMEICRFDDMHDLEAAFSEAADLISTLIGERDSARDPQDRPAARSASPICDQQLSAEREPIAHLVERTGPGYGKRRRVVLTSEYDPRKPEYWAGGLLPQNYSVTPLYPLSPQLGTAEEGEEHTSSVAEIAPDGTVARLDCDTANTGKGEP